MKLLNEDCTPLTAPTTTTDQIRQCWG